MEGLEKADKSGDNYGGDTEIENGDSKVAEDSSAGEEVAETQAHSQKARVPVS